MTACTSSSSPPAPLGSVTVDQAKFWYGCNFDPTPPTPTNYIFNRNSASNATALRFFNPFIPGDVYYLPSDPLPGESDFVSAVDEGLQDTVYTICVPESRP